MYICPEDHFEAIVDVFVTMLKLGATEAAPVSFSKVVQLWSGLRLTAKEFSQYVRFHRVELRSHFAEARAMLIPAVNGRYQQQLTGYRMPWHSAHMAQRRSREQPPTREHDTGSCLM